MFLYSYWTSLTLPTRIKLASAFDIVKRGPTEIDSNRIKSDGYVMQEVEAALTLEAIQNYLGTTETDLQVLWGWLVDKVEGKGVIAVYPPDSMPNTIGVDEPVIKAENPDGTTEEAPLSDVAFVAKDETIKPVIVKPKRGRPKKAK